MESIYQKVLDEFAKSQYNPKSGRCDFQTYEEMKEEYTTSKPFWIPYFKDIERATSIAVVITKGNCISELEKWLDTYPEFYMPSKAIIREKLKEMKI